MTVFLPHTPTTAIVVRAGCRTTLVVLPDWYRGQILVPVETWVVMMATGLTRAALPDTQLLVRARLGARTEQQLDLEGWELPDEVEGPAAVAA
ncbi:hypothetical protein ACFUJY_29435 [Streptomyces sp. NPDC057249]|uniref:hypothetical protein n=1 Tax=Streptomyces sp. NPDC057249 TaxID=3346067 RepID=UPI00362591E5